MPRFYCPQPLAAGAVIDLPDTVAHHARVVRLQPGADLTLFNGEGGQYAAQLASVDRKGATATIGAYSACDCELPYALTLAQALPEASKMDWIVEKAIELGVAAIAPLAAQRCVVRLAGERAEKRAAHWRAVIVAASEQSGRNRLAQLTEISSFDAWVRQAGEQPRILLSPHATESLAGWARRQAPQAVTLMVGPEGGFTEQEVDAARANGAIILSMGARVLRTETAGIAAIAAINALWGGM